MPVVFFWPSVIWSVTVHLVLVPAAEGVGADIKMEVVTNSVEISTSDSVPTIGSLVSFEEGIKGEAGASATTTVTTGTTTTATGTVRILEEPVIFSGFSVCS